MDYHALLIRSVIAPLWAAWERSLYLDHYRRLARTQFDPPEVVAARQWRVLRELLRHAEATVPFYRERLRQTGISAARIEGPDDFARLPILTKAEIRAHGHELLSGAYRGSRLRTKATSGSTGVPLAVRVDEPAMQFKRGCTLRTDEWSGWRLGEPVMLLWGSDGPPAWRNRLRNALLERIHYVDTLRLSDAALSASLRAARRRPPALLLGHAHSLYLLAEHARRQGGAGFRPRGIISTAMVLHQWQRRTIEEVFDCKVTDRYGCEEVSLIASECERHDGLHVNADGVYLEILRADGTPAAPGEAGAVVITDLVNRAMPIIRYQIGDMAVVSERACTCGRGLPLLERLEGREADYVVTASGRLVSGISLTDHFATAVPGLVQLQIVQETIDRLRFRMVRGPDFGPGSLSATAELVRQWFGEEMAFDFEFVDRIPQEPSGKYRFCISKVDRNSVLGHVTP